MAVENPSPRDLAAQLIDHARTDPLAENRGQAAGIAFHRIALELSRWLGAAGCHALLSRALDRAEADHPVLKNLDLAGGAAPRLMRLEESIAGRGEEPVASGLEAALVALFELVRRLIGGDLAEKLAEMSLANGLPDATNADDEEVPR